MKSNLFLTLFTGLYLSQPLAQASRPCQVVLSDDSFQTKLLPITEVVEKAVGCTAVPKSRYSYQPGDFSFSLEVSESYDAGYEGVGISLSYDNILIDKVKSKGVYTGTGCDESCAIQKVADLVTENMPLLLRKLKFPITQKDPASLLPTGSYVQVLKPINDVQSYEFSSGLSQTYFQGGMRKKSPANDTSGCLMMPYSEEMSWDDYLLPETRTPYALKSASLPVGTKLRLTYKSLIDQGGLVLGFEGAQKKFAFVCFEDIHSSRISVDIDGVPTIAQFQKIFLNWLKLGRLN